MVFEQLKKLSLNELIAALQDQIVSFSRGIDKLIDENNEINTNEIDQLRDHIKRRLDAGEERAENEQLLKLVNLFSDDHIANPVVSCSGDDHSLGASGNRSGHMQVGCSPAASRQHELVKPRHKIS